LAIKPKQTIKNGRTEQKNTIRNRRNRIESSVFRERRPNEQIER